MITSATESFIARVLRRRRQGGQRCREKAMRSQRQREVELEGEDASMALKMVFVYQPYIKLSFRDLKLTSSRFGFKSILMRDFPGDPVV